MTAHPAVGPSARAELTARIADLRAQADDADDHANRCRAEAERAAARAVEHRDLADQYQTILDNAGAPAVQP